MPVRFLFILFRCLRRSPRTVPRPVLYYDVPHKSVITWFLRMINCLPCWKYSAPSSPRLPFPPSKTRRHRHLPVLSPLPLLLFSSFFQKVNDIEEIKIHYVLSVQYTGLLCWNNGRGGKQKDKKAGGRGGGEKMERRENSHGRSIIIHAAG